MTAESFALDYNISPSYAGAIGTLLGSQLFGYGMAGIMRAFTIYPTYIVFPNLVPTVNLFDALHRDKTVLSQKKRLRFFWIVVSFLSWVARFIVYGYWILFHLLIVYHHICLGMVPWIFGSVSFFLMRSFAHTTSRSLDPDIDCFYKFLLFKYWLLLVFVNSTL